MAVTLAMVYTAQFRCLLPGAGRTARYNPEGWASALPLALSEPSRQADGSQPAWEQGFPPCQTTCLAFLSSAPHPALELQEIWRWEIGTQQSETGM